MQGGVEEGVFHLVRRRIVINPDENPIAQLFDNGD